MTTLLSTARLLQTCRVPVVQLRHAIRLAHGMDDARLRDADAVQSGLVRCTCGIMHQLVPLPVLLNQRKLRMSWRLRATTETAIIADLQEEALGNASYIRDSAEQVSCWLIDQCRHLCLVSVLLLILHMPRAMRSRC